MRQNHTPYFYNDHDYHIIRNRADKEKPNAPCIGYHQCAYVSKQSGVRCNVKFKDQNKPEDEQFFCDKHIQHSDPNFKTYETPRIYDTPRNQLPNETPKIALPGMTPLAHVPNSQNLFTDPYHGYHTPYHMAANLKIGQNELKKDSKITESEFVKNTFIRKMHHPRPAKAAKINDFYLQQNIDSEPDQETSDSSDSDVSETKKTVNENKDDVDEFSDHSDMDVGAETEDVTFDAVLEYPTLEDDDPLAAKIAEPFSDEDRNSEDDEKVANREPIHNRDPTQNTENFRALKLRNKYIKALQTDQNYIQRHLTAKNIKQFEQDQYDTDVLSFLVQKNEYLSKLDINSNRREAEIRREERRAKHFSRHVQRQYDEYDVCKHNPHAAFYKGVAKQVYAMKIREIVPRQASSYARLDRKNEKVK